MSIDDEWWCPTEKRYVSCPGPCPDGRVHPASTRNDPGQSRGRSVGSERDTPLGHSKSYTLIVPGRLTTVNATRRHHWAVDAAQTKLWRSDGYVMARAAKIPWLDKVTITATPQQARGRLADAGAHSGCVKAVVDSLVDAGVIEADGPDVVVSLNQCAPVRVDARDEGLRIVIEEML